MDIFSIFRKRKKYLDVLQEYFTKKSHEGLSSATLKKHQFFYANIREFFEINRMMDLPVTEIKLRVMEELRAWLLSSPHGRSCSIGHASRHIEHCVAAMDYAVLMEYTKYNPISAIPCKRDRTKDAVSLTTGEILRVMNYEAKSKTVELVVDLFLFQCFTGLSYGDLWCIKKMKYKGVEFLSSGREKNGQKYYAVFNQYARAIYKKHDGQFPFVCNQVYNKTIRKVIKNLGIQKHITTHVGRKTYATLKFNLGQSLESIAIELGNTPEILRRNYITKGPERLLIELEKVGELQLIPN